MYMQIVIKPPDRVFRRRTALPRGATLAAGRRGDRLYRPAAGLFRRPVQRKALLLVETYG